MVEVDKGDWDIGGAETLEYLVSHRRLAHP
jgi:hypothetical protein